MISFIQTMVLSAALHSPMVCLESANPFQSLFPTEVTFAAKLFPGEIAPKLNGSHIVVGKYDGEILKRGEKIIAARHNYFGGYSEIVKTLTQCFGDGKEQFPYGTVWSPTKERKFFIYLKHWPSSDGAQINYEAHLP